MANDTTSELNAPLPRIPRMMTIRQVASTGILPETALRTMVKDGTIPAVFAGCKAFINFDQLCIMLINFDQLCIMLNRLGEAS